MENWKWIPGTGNTVEVSDLGRVRSWKSGQARILKAQKDAKGYLRVTVTNKGKHSTYKVHRLVANAFLPTPAKEKNQVNHINGDKTNNKSWNLEWVTNRENALHARANGLWDSVIEGSKRENESRKKPVIAYKDGKEICFESVSDAERHFNSRHISDVLKGKRQRVKGWSFSYAKGGDQHCLH